MSESNNTKESDSNKITMTLPPAVMGSMKNEGEPLDMTAGEWAKHMLIAAYTQPDGVHLNLRPVARDRAQGHPELPLGGGLA